MILLALVLVVVSGDGLPQNGMIVLSHNEYIILGVGNL
jgi:hypothetical protein